MTLSAIATLIVESFLPDTYQKYLFLNYKQSTQYRSYRSIVPEYLHGKPRSVIIHCLERRSKSLKYIQGDVHIINDDEGTFTVTSSSGEDYKVSFTSTPSCTCRDWVAWHIPCKHFFAVFRFYPSWNWKRLPESYKKSAYLSTDTGALNTFFHGSSTEVDNQLPDNFTPEEENKEEACDEIPKQEVSTLCNITLSSYISTTPFKHINSSLEA